MLVLHGKNATHNLHYMIQRWIQRRQLGGGGGGGGPGAADPPCWLQVFLGVHRATVR